LQQGVLCDELIPFSVFCRELRLQLVKRIFYCNTWRLGAGNRFGRGTLICNYSIQSSVFSSEVCLELVESVSRFDSWRMGARSYFDLFVYCDLVAIMLRCSLLRGLATEATGEGVAIRAIKALDTIRALNTIRALVAINALAAIHALVAIRAEATVVAVLVITHVLILKTVFVSSVEVFVV
jgi:hypothetical protein